MKPNGTQSFPAPPASEASAAGSRFLDTSGLCCPEPLMLLHQTMNKLQPGAVLELVVTDAASHRDIWSFCRHLGHECLDVANEGQDRFRFVIKKRQD